MVINGQLFFEFRQYIIGKLRNPDLFLETELDSGIGHGERGGSFGIRGIHFHYSHLKIDIGMFYIICGDTPHDTATDYH
jgi:hypothetical protein